MTQPPIPTTAGAPEEVGIPRENLARAVEKLENGGYDPHAFAVARRGKLIAQGAWEPYVVTDEVQVYSVSKTFTATAIGYLVADGKVGLDTPAWQYLVAAEPAGERSASITVAHLLAMDTGHTVEQLAQPQLSGNYDPSGLFEVEPEHEPGTHFAYNSYASFLLSAIVQRLTGMRLSEFLRPRFFDPLGITERYWAPRAEFDQGYSGLHLNVHDLISLGAAYLNWPGAQVLPAGWSALASQIHAPNSHQDELPDNSSGYGFQVWRNQHGFRADGALGQYSLIVPELDLVIAYQGATPWPRTQEVLQIWWDEVVVPLKRGPALALGDDAPTLPLTPHLQSPITLPPVPPEVPIAAEDIVPGEHRFDAARGVLQLGEYEFEVSETWQRSVLPMPGDQELRIALIGHSKTGGGWEGSLIVTSSCHRLLWSTKPGDDQVKLAWHIAPLRSPLLADLAIPS